MLITIEELAQFSNTHKDDDEVTTSLLNIYIGSATEIIQNYLGYDPEVKFTTIPSLMKLTCLEIASLMQMEEGNNLGINSKSFGVDGSRTYLNQVDYSKYLKRLARWKAVPDGSDTNIN